MTRAFRKMHGLGNDFVVFDARAEPLALTAAQVRGLADRNTGIGCDQLIVIEPSDRATAFMRIYNADGGEVEACGNAARCVATLLGDNATIDSVAGILDATAADAAATIVYPPPKFDWDAIPLAYPMDTRDMPVAWPWTGGGGDDDALAHPVAVNVGNPHIIFFVPDADAVPLGVIGPVIEHDALFPQRINVNVAQMINRSHLRLRVWERGVGLTRACGTGACAPAVAAMRRGLADRSVTVDLPGGALAIEWRTDGTIAMTGPAATSFTGEIDLAAYS
jgi:diaminopimelate epimerase